MSGRSLFSLNRSILKEINPGIFIRRTNTDWAPDVKSRLTGKDHDAGKDGGKEEKGVTEDEVVGWHHCLNGHEFKQTLGNSEGQGSLECCSPCGHRESDMTSRLNNNKPL